MRWSAGQSNRTEGRPYSPEEAAKICRPCFCLAGISKVADPAEPVVVEYAQKFGGVSITIDPLVVSIQVKK
jgi:hypothetical protein